MHTGTSNTRLIAETRCSALGLGFIPRSQGIAAPLLEAWLLLKGCPALKPKRNRKTRATDNRRTPTCQKEPLRDEAKPKREITRTINQFRRCVAYLKAMRVNIEDPAMHDYWFACILSDGFSDARLAKIGTVNFDTMSGHDLLAAFEAILSEKPKKATARKLKPADTVETIKGAASEAEIIAGMTPKGGWKAATLAQWGVAWPPPAGWRRKLVENFEARAG